MGGADSSFLVCHRTRIMSSSSSSSSGQGPARTRAKKRVLAEIEEQLNAPVFAYTDNVLLVDRAIERVCTGDPTEQMARRTRVQSAFTPAPSSTTVLSGAGPEETDAEFSMWRRGEVDDQPHLNAVRLYYDENKDSWALSMGKVYAEAYWTLRHDVKLAVLDRWVQDPVLLNEMAQRVNAKLASLEKEAKASFTAAAAQVQDKLSTDLPKDEQIEGL